MRTIGQTSARRGRAARTCSEVLDPAIWVVIATFVVAIDAAGPARRIWLAVLMLVLVVALPYTVLLAGVRRGRYDDRHLNQREHRPFILAVALMSVLAAVMLMWFLAAPRALFALLAGMASGIACCLGISLGWKVSLHSACAAGAIGVMAVLVSPGLLVLTPLVGLVAWSRVVLERHTIGQVVVGPVVGGLVSGGLAAVVASA